MHHRDFFNTFFCSPYNECNIKETMAGAQILLPLHLASMVPQLNGWYLGSAAAKDSMNILVLLGFTNGEKKTYISAWNKTITRLY
jgi:hypothetical protein